MMCKDRQIHRSRTTLHAIAVLLMVVSTGAHAQVYRSVDESGHVTFSDAPPAGAVEVAPVEIQPGPTTEQVEQAQARADATREQLDALREARAAEAEREREARMQRLEEEALRAAARPPVAEPASPDRSEWSYSGYGFYGYPGYPAYPAYPVRPGYPTHPAYPGYPVRPWPPPPPPRRPAPPPRPKVLDSPLYNKSVSPVYR